MTPDDEMGRLHEVRSAQEHLAYVTGADPAHEGETPDLLGVVTSSRA
ncbi:hypothetical protein [Streptomyces sp. NPDC093089]